MTAKSTQRLLRKQPNLNEARPEVDAPALKWKVIAQIVAVFAILWLTAAMTIPYFGYWGIGVMGVITLLVAGFSVYSWRLIRKTRSVARLLQVAQQDAAGRQKALEELDRGSDKDALNALAKAQLLATEQPLEAIRVLEAVDIKKAPAMTQDDIRANLALLYLMHNRVREASVLAREIRLDRQPNPKAKAMYAAVTAEAFARTGSADEAKKLLETYRADDPAYGEMRAMLLRAQVYTYVATKNRGLARQAMFTLSQLDPNLLGAFLRKGESPELTRLAREILGTAGLAPKMKIKTRAG